MEGEREGETQVRMGTGGERGRRQGGGVSVRRGEEGGEEMGGRGRAGEGGGWSVEGEKERERGREGHG